MVVGLSSAPLSVMLLGSESVLFLSIFNIAAAAATAEPLKIHKRDPLLPWEILINVRAMFMYIVGEATGIMVLSCVSDQNGRDNGFRLIWRSSFHPASLFHVLALLRARLDPFNPLEFRNGDVWFVLKSAACIWEIRPSPRAELPPLDTQTTLRSTALSLSESENWKIRFLK